jgi:putative tryptophan/tyrosine transport system substrate-binding protein
MRPTEFGAKMKRRTFLGVLSGAAAWPMAAHAQQPAVPVVGYLSSLAQNERPNLIDAFRRGLDEAGYVEGRNVAIEYRFADNQYNQLPALAADLVNRKVAVIAATGGSNVIAAAKAATTAVPIVFTFGGDAVRAGYVSSINRPGGNVTGVTFFNVGLSSKGLELLHGLVPAGAVIGLMTNPRNQESEVVLRDAQDAARKLGRQLLVLHASTAGEIDAVFATLRQRKAGGLLIGGDPFVTTRRHQVVTLAARDALPVVYANRDFVVEGGLMSYGNDVADAYRRAALHVGRILKGEKPAELPVDQATKFEFLINLKTAKALGLNLPPTLVALADEVIE